MEEKTITRKMWTILIVFGLFGQIAWAVENMYFNLFVYNTIAKSTQTVTLMVQLSGITATLVTLFAGIFSDKLGNRRHFISIGYIIWGVVIASFAFISTNNTMKTFGIDDMQKAISITCTIVIVMDCVMTLFGSTANDAAFNAWVTDNTETSNRGKVEGVLSIMPLLALLIVAGGFGILVDLIGYDGMFIALGVIVVASGIIGLFTIKDAKTLQKSNDVFYKDLIYGFKPSVIKSNVSFYIVLLAVLLYCIASQIFMPYLIIYLQEYLHFTVIEYSLVLGLVILLGATAVVFITRASDKHRKDKLAYIFTGIFSIGLIAMYFVKFESHIANIIVFAIFGLVMIIGYISLMSLLGALTRDYTPQENAGKMQGIRMIFYVLIPMFVGPAIGQALNESQGITYVDPDTGYLANVPAPEIFLVAGLVALLVFIPLVFLTRHINKNEAKVVPIEEKPQEEAKEEIKE
ncbi:MAG: MFS transporter [Clostridia bacterium]|nr:MFS transporter [Clostridia bacterium]